jgi:hypothetical protein
MARKSVKSKKSTRKPTDRQKALGSPYARAVMNPKDGPLVGVPQFVPIKSHVARVRAILTHSMDAKGCSIFFNPMGMVANDYRSIVVYDNAGGTAVSDVDRSTLTGDHFATANGTYSTADFGDANDLKARVVGAMIRVCNTSNAQVRDGVFTALHEPHHHSLEDYTQSDMAKRSESIILPANAGQWVTLKYRTVRPEEVEEWQTEPGKLADDVLLHTGAGDGGVYDMSPGYMRIDLQGCSTTLQALQIEAYAIIEYVGETVQALVRNVSKYTSPQMIPHVNRAAQIQEQTQAGKNRSDAKDLHDFLDVLFHKMESSGQGSLLKLGMLAGEDATHDVVMSTEQIIAAEVANASYVAEKTAGDVSAIQNELSKMAPYVPELNDLQVVKVLNNNKDVIIKNVKTGEISVSYAGTTMSGVEDATVNWLFNNPAIQAGYRGPQHMRSANTMAEAIHMADGDASLVTTFGHSQGGAYAMDLAEQYGTKSVTFDSAIYRGQQWVKGEHTLFRTKFDPVTAGFSPRVTHGLKETGTLKVVTQGAKVGTFDGGLAKGAIEAHSLDQFRIMPTDEVAVVDEGIAMTKMSGAATTIKAVEAGATAFQAAMTAWEIKGDIEQASKDGKAMEAIGDVGTDVAADALEMVEVAGMAEAGAAAGAFLGPVGAAVGGILGAGVGILESTVIDKARDAVKAWFHRHSWF